MPGKCTFNELWLNNSDFKKWLTAVESNKHKAYCTLCKKCFDVSNMGQAAISSHAKSTKHQEMINVAKKSATCKDFFKPPGTPAASSSADRKQSDLNSIVSRNDVLTAEIWWALKVNLSHYSFNSCAEINVLFKSMFPDSTIADKFTCSERKCAYLTCFGIAPYLKSLVTSTVKEQENFILCFDESLNHKLQLKQIDYHVRMWQQNKIITRYLDSSFVGHATADIILEKFKECFTTNSLPFHCLLQLSMDGPNVNWKFYQLLQEFLNENYNCQTLNIGSCGLHIVHNAFKVGIEQSGWKIDALLSSIYYHFKDSPARREDFVRITGSSTFGLKFCSHRWVENISVVERVQLIWPNILQYVKAVHDGKLKIPQNKSFEVLKEFSSDLMVTAKLACFQFVARIIEPFLVQYQTDKPVLPFLSTDLFLVIKSLLVLFMKPAILENCANAFHILKLQLDDVKTHLDYTKIDVGVVADNISRDLKDAKKISEKDIMTFKLDSKKFFLKTVQKLLEKAPVRYVIVRNMSCLDPKSMREKEACFTKFKNILVVLLQNKKIKPNVCDNAAIQFRNFLDEISKTSFFEDSSVKDLDNLYHDALSSQVNYNDLWSVIKQLLLLSHGQASVERGFSINKNLEVENLKQDSYKAQRIINDHLKSVGGLTNFVISKELLLSAASSRQKYMLYLEEKKIDKEKDDKLQKKSLLQNRIKEIGIKLKNLQRDVNDLEKSADKYALEAEKNRDFSAISKSNSLRKGALEKRQDIKQLEIELSEMTENLKDL